MRRCWVLFLVLFTGLMGLAQTTSAQCAMCVTGLTQSPEGQAMARNFNRAILFLLTIPYLIAATFTLLLLHHHARRQHVRVWDLVRSRFLLHRVRRYRQRRPAPS